MNDLPSVPERDLPRGRHHLLKEHLMSEIRQPTQERPVRDAYAPDASTPGASAPGKPAPRRPWLRPAFAGPAIAGALAVAALVTLTLTGGDEDGARIGRDGTATYAFAPNVGADEQDGAPQLLDRIATVAEKSKGSELNGPIRDDQFVYVNSKVAWSTAEEGKPLTIDKLHRREAWLSVDGTGKGLAREEGREPYSFEPEAQPGELGYDQSDSYRHLQTLPTDPDRMYEWLRKTAIEGDAEDTEQGMFVLVGDLINESLVPSDVSAALFRAAGRIPGVVVVDEAVDAAGRTGVAVARVDDNNDIRDEWIFDRTTQQYLGARSVLLKGMDGAEAGTVTGTSAILDRAVVNKVGQRP
ncbi:CU044_5270 family protein [Streptomyces zagrosensis]|uniref:CU044_5270 family protein n=1 Tax=Streptomyces zagrosensis TaxID=1042984 RepID=A0A7W9V1Q3_9ACTN|nr:CU044_5270 family protein [Streptomyces zagrosensis]MBB5938024.1 hypothetical protein [Streptomyces zagrosensis]